ncbi:hypothetical protein K439DRAFT_56870 [Ramaria rubella]|nr:hypothetical protein K439DRAFT_56870 [Ramaria rubella]
MESFHSSSSTTTEEDSYHVSPFQSPTTLAPLNLNSAYTEPLFDPFQFQGTSSQADEEQDSPICLPPVTSGSAEMLSLHEKEAMIHHNTVPPRNSLIISNADHSYRHLTSTGKDVLDQWLQRGTGHNQHIWKCIGERCDKHFSRKSTAHAHIRKDHIGEKLYECTTCKRQFASDHSAKRHRDNQVKRFPCTVLGCTKVFRRADYCHIHQKSCALRMTDYSGPTKSER